MDIQCKGCSKDLKNNQILRHISHTKNCKLFYSKQEIAELQLKSTKRANERKRTHYDPSKRAERYKAKLGKLSGNNSSKNEISKVTDKNDLLCRGCEKFCSKKSIFRHIAKNISCNNFYNSCESNKKELKIMKF